VALHTAKQLRIGVIEIVTEKQHIERRPGVMGGKPCIAGPRIRVQDIYYWHLLNGQTPEQIVADFPQFTLADVYAGIAYYYDHQQEIHTEIQDALAFVANMKAAAGPQLIDRLRAAAQAHHTPPHGNQVSS
jgi:uncharacterized protein (DUF433 family)